MYDDLDSPIAPLIAAVCVAVLLIGMLVLCITRSAHKRIARQEEAQAVHEAKETKRSAVVGVVDRYEFLGQGERLAIYFDDGNSLLAWIEWPESGHHQLMIPLHQKVTIVRNDLGYLVPDPDWIPQQAIDLGPQEFRFRITVDAKLTEQEL